MVQKYIKILVILTWLASCTPDSQQFSTTPTLKLDGAPTQFQRNGKDSSVIITLDYTDGDGDIGLEAGDTFPPFNYGSKFFYNLFVDVYQVENGQAKPIIIPLTTDSVRFNDRIANLTPTGRNKSIFGKLTLHLNAIPYPGVLPDSMFYKIQLADRSLKVSNVITTPVLKFQF